VVQVAQDFVDWNLLFANTLTGRGGQHCPRIRARVTNVVLSEYFFLFGTFLVDDFLGVHPFHFKHAELALAQ
jgi:hypothetical protein